MIAPAPRHGAKLAADLFDELIVDNFAGGGGASIGIERALGRAVDLAVNHDREAVAMHSINHPNTLHLCEDVWNVDPLEATGGRPVGLAWFSPDCKHFSKAKGGKPVSKRIRGLAWVVVRWARAVRPRVVILENVEEFTTWGPLGPDDRPCPTRKGQTFRAWWRQLERLGYAVEKRELRACDYGAPTIRKRLFVIARCDGRPIVWPTPTHAHPDKARQAGLRPWRTAAECIDFSLPCPSIFERERPLAENTLRRIARGIRRYVIDNPRPFIVRMAHGDRARYGRGEHPTDEPLPTMAASKDFAVVDPFLATCNHGGDEFRGQALDQPMRTLTASRDAHGLVTPHVTMFRGGATGKGADEPLPTITAGSFEKREAGAGHAMGLVSAHLTKYHGPKAGETRGQELTNPLLTQDTQNRFGVVAAGLVGCGGSSYAGKPRGVEQPLNVVKTDNHQAAVSALLTRLCQNGGNGKYSNGVDEPLTTLVSKNEHALTAATIIKQNFGERGGDSSAVDGPLHTITGQDNRHCLAAAALVQQHGNSNAHPVDSPINTITAGGCGHMAEVRAFLVKYYSTAVGQDCRDPMHTLTARHREGLVTVEGVDYAIADIGLRMLEPVELYKAQGFPVDRHGRLAYVIAPVVNGKRLSKAAQVRMVGNSVSPSVAEAVVRANCADLAVEAVA